MGGNHYLHQAGKEDGVDRCIGGDAPEFALGGSKGAGESDG